MHTAGRGTEYERAMDRFTDRLRLYGADFAICSLFLASGLISGLARCILTPAPQFWTLLTPQLYCLAVAFTGIRFGLGPGLASAAAASVLAIAANMVCALSDTRLNLTVLLFVVGLAAGWVGRRRAVARNNTETETARRQKGSGAKSISELGRLMPEVVDQFRTPIASIQGVGFVLEDPDLSPERREEFVGILRKECHHLQLLVELLDFTRARWSADGKVDIRELFEEVIAQCVSSVGSRLTLKNLATGDPRSLHCEPELMKHALVTLVNEIILAIPGRGVVALSANASPSEILLCVDATTEEGLSARALLGGASSQNNLTIVRNVIDRHGGVLRIEPSTATGVSISIILPTEGNTRYEHRENTPR